MGKKRLVAQDISQLKLGLTSHMKSSQFQKAFERMVKKTLNDHTEWGFHIMFLKGKIGSSGPRGGISPYGMLDETTMTFPKGKEPSASQIPLVGLHTHPYSGEDSAAKIPSPTDVQTGGNTFFGIVVPVNLKTNMIDIVAYQGTTALSHIAYENLWSEMADASSIFHKEVLWHSVERAILRVAFFEELKRFRLTHQEVDNIIGAMNFSQDLLTKANMRAQLFKI